MQRQAASEALGNRFADSMRRAVAQDLSVEELLGCVEVCRVGDRIELAQELYRTWIDHNAADPALPPVMFNYGTLLLAARDLPGARTIFQAVIALQPDFVVAHINLAVTLEAQGELAPALAQWLVAADRMSAVTGEAVRHKALVLKQVSRIYQLAQDYEHAEETLRLGLDLDPGQRDAAQHWIATRQAQCKWPVIQAGAEAPSVTLADAKSPLLVARYADSPMLQLAMAHAYYQSDVALGRTPHTVGSWPPPDPPRPGPLRIGYVCSDMRAHALGSLLAGLFALHDRKRFEVFAYYTGPDVQDRIRALSEATADHWRTIARLSDKHASALIGDDGIDVLIDLNGYTNGARERLFALRPAPIIVNWLGYPGSMGTPHHHYIIADANIIPPHLEKYYSETVRRLPCYQPNDRDREVSSHTPTRAELGLPEAAFVYCCFNTSVKFTPTVFRRWMLILSQVPRAVLWLLSSGGPIDDRLRRAAAQAGIAPERLVFAAAQPSPEHLARYRLADLFLDTSPYGAHTTASDALWMGLPVMTLTGHSFASRVCGSLVRSAGLPELVCDTPQAYVQTAILLGQDDEALARHRETLRLGHETCTLFDTPGLVLRLEELFDGMWNDYVEGCLPVPDLTNLDLYAEIGADEERETIDALDLGRYEDYYRRAMEYRDALSAVPRDCRLWDGAPAS